MIFATKLNGILTRNEKLKTAVLEGENLRALVDDPRWLSEILSQDRLRDRFLSMIQRSEVLDACFENAHWLDSMLDRFVSNVSKRTYGGVNLLERSDVVESVVGSQAGLEAVTRDPSKLATIATDKRFADLVTSETTILESLLKRDALRQFLIEHPRLLKPILLDHRFYRVFKEDSDYLKKLLSDEDVRQSLLLDERMDHTLLESPRILARLVSSNIYLRKILKTAPVQKLLKEDAALSQELFADEVALTRVLNNPRLLSESLSKPEVFSAILQDNDFFTKFLWNETNLSRIHSDPKLLARIVSQDRALGRIFADESLLKKILNNDRTFEVIRGNPELSQKVTTDSDVINRVLESPLIMNALYEDPRTLTVLLLQDEIVKKILWNEKTLSKINSDNKLLSRIVSQDRALGKILSEEYLLNKILSNDISLQLIATDPSLMRRIVQKEQAKRLIFEDERTLSDILGDRVCQERLLAHPGLKEALITDSGRVIEVLQDERTLDNEAATERVLAVHEFHRVWNRLKSKIDTKRPHFHQKLSRVKSQISKRSEIPGAFLELVCTGNELCLSEGRLRILEGNALWVLIQEILLNEDYYFESTRPDPRILDLGSNFGLSIYYFKSLYPHSRITGFEPVPEIFGTLEDNMSRLKFSDVEVLPFAISDTEGEVEFLVSEDDTMAGSLTQRRKFRGENIQPIKVQTRRLREYLNEPIDFIKMDIEGSEDKVLEDCHDLLPRVGAMFIEYHHGNGLSIDRLGKILDTLYRAGFDTQISKSYSSGKETARRPMLAVGNPYSASIWAKNIKRTS